MSEPKSKAVVRRQLKALLAGMTEAERHQKSILACNYLAETPEFRDARVVMLYLSTPHEIDTAPLALKCWQADKTVVVPKVSWDQRRMLPVEITSLQTGITVASTQHQIREPIAGNPMPVDMIDLAIVPGLGFTASGHRIGRGMGFYDRFLAQDDFHGTSCGLAFGEQMITDVPILDHDISLSMLVTNQGTTRFESLKIVAAPRSANAKCQTQFN